MINITQLLENIRAIRAEIETQELTESDPDLWDGKDVIGANAANDAKAIAKVRKEGGGAFKFSERPKKPSERHIWNSKLNKWVELGKAPGSGTIPAFKPK
jgi:hypothetical protein